MAEIQRESYTFKECKAKLQVEKKDRTDFHLIIRRDVDTTYKPLKDGDVEVDVKHQEKVTVLPWDQEETTDNWLIKIDREYQETSRYHAKEVVEKISRRREYMDRNLQSPIIAAIMSQEKAKKLAEAEETASSRSIHGSESGDYEVVNIAQLESQRRNITERSENERREMNEYVEISSGIYPLRASEKKDDLTPKLDEDNYQVSDMELETNQLKITERSERVERKMNEYVDLSSGRPLPPYFENEDDKSQPHISILGRQNTMKPVMHEEEGKLLLNEWKGMTQDVQLSSASESERQNIQVLEMSYGKEKDSSEADEKQIINSSLESEGYVTSREIQSGEEDIIQETPNPRRVRELFHMDISEIIIERERKQFE